MLTWLSLLTMANAEDILLPQFTPTTLNDITVAEKFEGVLLNELRALGRNVISPQTLKSEYPQLASTCFTTPNCANTMLNRPSAMLLLVGSVENTPDGYNVIIRYYGRGDASPLDTKAGMGLQESEVDAFLLEAAQDASVIYELIPALPDPNAEVDVAPPPPIAPPTQPIVVKKENSLDDDVRLKGLPLKLQEDYLASPLSVEEWMKIKRIRAGNVSVEIHLGVSFGDVIRRYDTRIGLVQTNEELKTWGIYEYDSFISGGPGVNMGGSVGFAPAWWLETSIYGGVVLYQKELGTGWEHVVNGELEDYDYVNYDPTTSAAGHIEPRIRLYMAPSGPVKPYILTGAFIRIFDGYSVPDLANVNYPNRPGGVHVGATGGIGLAFDSYSPVGVFLEIPYTYLLNSTYYYNEEISSSTPDYTFSDLPEQLVYTNQVLAFKVGVSLRFQ